MKIDKPIILTLLSPRYEFAYRVHDALLELPWVSKLYSLHMVPYSPYDEPMPSLDLEGVAGVITALDSDVEDMRPLQKLEIPVINLTTSTCDGIGSVAVDQESMAEVVVRHAVGASYEHLLFLPTRGAPSQECLLGGLLQEAAERVGLSYGQVAVKERPLGVSLQQWMDEHVELMERLKGCEQRTLVFSTHDWRASTLRECCRLLGVSVPSKVGLLGRSNSLDSRMGNPQISSVSMPYLSMANEAVKMIRNEEVKDVRIDSGEIVPRESTVGQQKVGDEALRIAELIRVHGAEGITVDQLAQIAGSSRSTLERNYRKVHGEAPSVALKRVRMQHVERLLKTTDLTIQSIAQMAGFASTRSFFAMFEREHGMPPGRWRKVVSQR